MQSSSLGCDLTVASLTAMVTVVVMAGGGYASCRWCGESGTTIMSSAVAEALLLLLLLCCMLYVVMPAFKVLMGVAWLQQ